MAVFAIAFVFNEAKDDAQMQQNRRHDKLARHLGVGNLQRIASGTVHCSFQGERWFCVQEILCVLEMVMSDLHPIRDAWRT
jgi:hypothetical protein